MLKYLAILIAALLLHSCSKNATEPETVKWIELNSGFTGHPMANTLAINGNNIFVGTKKGVILSMDNGQSWTNKSVGLPDAYVECITFIGNTIFIGTDGYGVFRSIDNGNSWTAQNNGIIHSKIISLATKGIYLYAGTGNGIFVSDDNGESWTANGNQWTAKSKAIPGHDIKSIVPDGEDIYAAAYHLGIYKSSDNCNSWNETVARFTIFPNCMAISANTFYVGTESGLFLSTDKGKTWVPKIKGTPLPDSWPFGVDCIAIKGSTIFTGIMDKGVYLSTDNGDNWKSIGPYKTWSDSPHSQRFYPWINSIVIHDDYVFIACNYGIFKTRLSDLK